VVNDWILHRDLYQMGSGRASGGRDAHPPLDCM
jgi:hypothetical protein